MTVKLPGPVAVPPAVVTDTVPVVAPGITKPTSWVPVLEITRAVTPPMVKAVGLPRLVPVMVNSVPIGPLAGVKEVMVGVGKNINPVLVAVPPGVVTLMLPVAPLATTTVIVLASTTVNEVAAIPPKLTAVAPVKLVPVMVTVAPAAADVGVNEVIVGAAINVNPVRVPVPTGVVTLTSPDVPFATTAVMLVALTTVKDVAAVPPKVTAVAPVKLVPVMVTVAPVPADAGVNEVMAGKGI